MRRTHALALVAALVGAMVLGAGLANAGQADVDLTMNSITVSGSTVTINVTNNSTSKGNPVAVNVEATVRPHQCDNATLPAVDCAKGETAGTTATIGAGATADIDVTFTGLAAGDYVFHAWIGASKGGDDERIDGFAGGVIP